MALIDFPFTESPKRMLFKALEEFTKYARIIGINNPEMKTMVVLSLFRFSFPDMESKSCINENETECRTNIKIASLDMIAKNSFKCFDFLKIFPIWYITGKEIIAHNVP